MQAFSIILLYIYSIHIVLSTDSDTIFLLSGLIATEVSQLVYPVNILIKLPDF